MIRIEKAGWSRLRGGEQILGHICKLVSFERDTSLNQLRVVKMYITVRTYHTRYSKMYTFNSSAVIV